MKVLVAMSGGVDSSVAALLLAEAGHEIIGATMSLWDPPAGQAPSRPCCGAEETWGAKAVCDLLAAPHYTFDLRAEFRRHVVDPFVADYRAARTPNPCVECNRHLKFGALLAKARLLGCSHVATGHYARLAEEDGHHLLRRAADGAKDQSYFLWPLPAEGLSQILFPLADLDKAQVRALAQQRGLPTAKRAESQDVCFIPGGTAAFLEGQGLTPSPGDLVHEDGRLLGRHQGIHRYTLGQRKGLGIAWPTPLYVKALEVATNRVVVCGEEGLWTSSFTVPALNVLAPWLWSVEQAYEVRVRYRSRGKPARIRPLGKGVEVTLLEPERGVTPGQSAVFYLDDTVVAGGEIGE